jgi:uncharacterized protein YbgA (DUF1722 family)/uncharacterized protein YbbK (DUF523 family)
MTAATSDDDRRAIRIGISSCLLGQAVRYDAGHKRDAFLVDTFGKFVEWVPVCPEVEAGFGTPREAMRLVGASDGIRLLTIKSKQDVTAQLETAIARRMRTLPSEQLSGYILKRNSPSCGLQRVKVYNRAGTGSSPGQGLFATALTERFPHLPVEEEGRLSDPRLRENFVERVFAYSRLRALFVRGWTVASLMRFHAVHKLILMAHSPAATTALGRIAAEARTLGRPQAEQRYTDGFMRALAIIASPRRHTNVLQHMAGYFKRVLDAESREELAGTIEDYRLGLVPLIVPITLLRHHVRVHRVEYLADQLYLAPHPKELMLRNHT